MYPSPYIRFDGRREEIEWFSGRGAGEEFRGHQLHPALYALVLAAALWHYRRTGKPVVITHILRSRAEQRKIYPDKPGRRSPHEFGRAADLRTRRLDSEIAREWAEWINQSFEYLSKTKTKTALVHEVDGRGVHLHLQIGSREPTPEKPDSYIQA